MTAVLHAEYSYVHVTALDIHILAAERDPTRRQALRAVLERNLSRIKEGFDILRRDFEPGEHGREFMEGFYAWTERTIASARDLLGRRPRPSGLSLLEAATAGSSDCVHVAAVAAKPLPYIDTSANTCTHSGS